MFDVREFTDRGDGCIIARAVSAEEAAELLGGVTADYVASTIARWGYVGVNDLEAVPTGATYDGGLLH